MYPNKCQSERVIVPAELYGADARDMRSADRRKVNVIETKCLRNLAGVMQLDGVRNYIRGALTS